MRNILAVLVITLSQLVFAQVPVSFERIGVKYNVDPTLLYALSMTETARKSNFNTTTPWPWTANICKGQPGVGCKGYWFKTREELYEALNKQLQAGNDWFDVGIMQMNWHFHKKRFGEDLWLATHPLVNINQAVGLLKDIQVKHKDLSSVFKAYHAGENFHKVQYSEKRKKQIDHYASQTLRHYRQIQKYLASQ